MWFLIAVMAAIAAEAVVAPSAALCIFPTMLL
jgi:hypothetical protein